MDFLGKLYKLDRTENFEGFVSSLNLPSDKVDAYLNSKPAQKLEKDGENFVLTTYYGEHGSGVTFQSGVEFEEDEMGGNIKTKIDVDGNKVTQTQKLPEDKEITIVREYTEDLLEVTITTNFWSGTAKGYYVAQ